MGIQGLLPMLKEIQRPKHVKDYQGKTVGIDAYVWLHRGVFACPQEVALGQKTLKYVSYAMGKIRMLRHYGVKPYVVFDGGPLPSKQTTEDDRAKRRADALSKAKSLLAEGRVTQARDHFVKACDVTTEMAYQLMKALQRENVPYVCAPYEADAQLCALERWSMIDAILTEDSDLLVYGCKTVLFKMDAEGNVIEIKQNRLATCKEYRFDGWTETEFRHMAILSGCDYLPSCRGVGLKSSHTLMRKYKSAKKVIKSLRLSAKTVVPRTYDKDFQRADLTFLHQCVFDPRQAKLVHLTPLPEGGLATRDLMAVGAGLSDEMAAGIARGDIDPCTKKPMRDIFPDSQNLLTGRTISASQAVKGKSGFAAADRSGSERDIRNFFGTTTIKSSSKLKRKALSAVSPNSPPSKRQRVQAEKERLENAPQVKSKFFGAAKSATAEVESVIDLVDSDNEGGDQAHTPQISTPDLSPQQQAAVATLCEVDDAEDLEAEQAWRDAHEEAEVQAMADTSLDVTEGLQDASLLEEDDALDEAPDSDAEPQTDGPEYATSEMCVSDRDEREAKMEEDEGESQSAAASFSSPVKDSSLPLPDNLLTSQNPPSPAKVEMEEEAIEEFLTSPITALRPAEAEPDSTLGFERATMPDTQYSPHDSQRVSTDSPIGLNLSSQEAVTPRDLVVSTQVTIISSPQLLESDDEEIAHQTPTIPKIKKKRSSSTKKDRKGLSKGSSQESSIVIGDDEEGEQDEVTKSVIASWQARYMRPTNASTRKPNIRKAVALTESASASKRRESKPLAPISSTPKLAQPDFKQTSTKSSKNRLLPKFSIPHDVDAPSSSKESPIPSHKVALTDSRLKSFVFQGSY